MLEINRNFSYLILFETNNRVQAIIAFVPADPLSYRWLKKESTHRTPHILHSPFIPSRAAKRNVVIIWENKIPNLRFALAFNQPPYENERWAIIGKNEEKHGRMKKMLTCPSSRQYQQGFNDCIGLARDEYSQHIFVRHKIRRAIHLRIRRCICICSFNLPRVPTSLSVLLLSQKQNDECSTSVGNILYYSSAFFSPRSVVAAAENKKKSSIKQSVALWGLGEVVAFALAVKHET